LKLFLFIKQRANVSRGILSFILNSSVDISYGWTTKETFPGDSVSPFEIQNEISYFFNKLWCHFNQLFRFNRIGDNFSI